MSESTADDDICRYCFEGRDEGELISPCKCSGGQKYVHLNCLRLWQRRVLVSQPTHPAFYEEDLRHHRCNVCLSEYTCAPPSRAELMESFTGPELAALIEAGCIIAAHNNFSRHLEAQLQRVPAVLWDHLSYAHWIDGVYLITSVEPDDGVVTIPFGETAYLEGLKRRLAEDLTISFRGRKLKVAAKGSLEGVAESELAAALEDLSVPATLVLEPLQPLSCADDHIAAVNLARPTADAPDPGAVEEALEAARVIHPGAAEVEDSRRRGRSTRGRRRWRWRTTSAARAASARSGGAS
uniref:Protein involved in mrna turnover and stability n=1 Tax=Tetraselmis sp. GSL018 TaxID=582737 RepID=A0A061RWY6_9CHLO